ncbi:MAG: amidase family protein, partial [Parachlamydiaceae bacterium]
SLDQIGPMTPTVEDAALLMEVIGRHCDKDSTSLNAPPEEIVKTLATHLKGKKIGVPWEFLEKLASEPKALFMEALEKLKSLGAEIVDIDLSILKYSLGTYYIVACAEASTNLARFDGIRYGVRSKSAKTLDEVYTLSKEEGYGREVKRRIIMGTYVLSKGYQDAFYQKAQKVRALIIEHYKRAFSKCDLVATPCSPFAAFEIGTIHDPIQIYLEDIYTISVNLAGLPGISVPSALTQTGLPVGLQLIGPHMADRLVLDAAHAFEGISGLKNRMPELAHV